MSNFQLTIAEDRLTLSLRGRLDAYSILAVWREASEVLAEIDSARVVIDGTQIDYCDTAGAAMLLDLAQIARATGAETEFVNLSEQVQQFLKLFDPTTLAAQNRQEDRSSWLERIGQWGSRVGNEFVTLISFVGEAASALVIALRHPACIRWGDAMRIAREAGVDALPIVSLISFLIGVILAFQAAAAMSRFGAEVFVADLVGLAVLRELGPLMTAILLAGRSGAAFAAELGTMKVNEEIDALSTLGFEPVRFLAVPRILATVAVIPVLTVYANLIGLIGGAIVMMGFGISLVSYYQELLGVLSLSDLLTGLGKALLFGVIVAGVGCLRGLQAGLGAAAVGRSATSAVVSAIVLIVAVDGLFTVIFYYAGI
ncbi:Intermembrane phospholipid transport system permease protein MlaE [Candidatus Nitrotoga sp. HW29]|uniref:ABC transporter permease n=1 Tax=Candidatus Nitrotoga sp. HW29 TaxID=2886963 RepID=UPI001EF3A3F0|nr:ABC transporter permease [Candidatus Nitrotoga sp. HW29]CAH1903651.1 Intermembrane phospholipid transport system permease protein MlaE [Candidatus Nitrotoga sp. HW29]